MLLAAAGLLPAFALAWAGPGALLQGAPEPLLGASALALLASLPAAVALISAGKLPRIHGLWLLLPAAVLGLASWQASGTDSLAAWQAMAHGALCLVALLLGGSLGVHGQRSLLGGLVLLSLVHLSWALTRWWMGLDPAPVGATENTGLLSQAALPGAVAGAWLALVRGGIGRLLGLLACLGFVLHASLAPVMAGTLAFALCLSACAHMSSWARERRQVRAAFVAIALAALIGFVLRSDAAPQPSNHEPSVPAVSDGETGGIAVRALIWARIPSLLRERPLLGAGPGQFRAAFPPHRDPAEIEASSLDRSLGAESEVNHPHSDPLHALAEYGLIGGGSLLLFMALAWTRTIGALKSRSRRQAALGAAALALLLNSLVHAPLLTNPAAALPAFLVLGALLAPEDNPRPAGPAARLAACLPLLCLLACLPRAPHVLRHHNALAEAIEALEAGDSPGLKLAVERAALACPDSPSTLALLARLDPDPGGESWRSVLKRRPHSVEALNNLAILRARAGAADEALSLWEQARSLDPGHPGLLQNLARAAIEDGRSADALGLLTALRMTGHMDRRVPRHLASTCLERGRLELCLELLAFIDPALEHPDPFELLARSESVRDEDSIWSHALKVSAHWLWGHEHARSGAFEDARRSLYRAWLAAGGRAAPARLALELAAARFESGQDAEASALLEGLTGVEKADFEALPDWARAPLDRVFQDVR